MWKIAGRAALALAALGLAALALAATPAAAASPKGTFRITNDARRVVECNFIVDSRTRNYLKVHMGKTYQDDFSPKTLLQLACVRGVESVYGPLKLGVDYRFVSREGNRVAVVEGAEE